MAELLECKEGIRQKVAEGAKADFAYFFMNILASILASYGLLSNSTAVVIGAMIVAMLLGPITGVALALVDGEISLLKKAFLAEFLGVLCVLGVSFIIGLLNPSIPVGSEILARTAPNIMDLIIAMAGGAAGAYAMISPKLNVGLIGVAIATALVPPLASASILFSRGELDLASGAFLLFFTNFVGIQVSSSLVLWAHGYHKIYLKHASLNSKSNKALLIGNLSSFIFLIILAIVLGNTFWASLQKQQQEQELRQLLRHEVSKIPGGNLETFKTETTGLKDNLFVIIRTPKSVNPDQVGKIENVVQTLFQNPIELHVRSILIVEATKDGYVYTQPSLEDTETRLFEKLSQKLFSQPKPAPAQQATEAPSKAFKTKTPREKVK